MAFGDSAPGVWGRRLGVAYRQWAPPTPGTVTLSRQHARFSRLLQMCALVAFYTAATMFQPVCAARREATEQVSGQKRIYAAPLLEKGHHAWLSVYDEAGRGAGNALVSVNGTLQPCDAQGICNFAVPEADTLKIAVVDREGRELSQTLNYGTSGNLLVLDEQVAGAFTKLEELVQGEHGPQLLYAPPVVDKSSSFLVVGANFSGQFNEDRVSLDGRNADIFGGSSVCLLARASEKTSPGALKELFVMSGGEASNSREIDVCRLDTIRKEAEDGARTQIRVVVSGTNMPCIFELSTAEPAKLRLRGRGVGSTATVVSPGGDRNHVVFEVEGPNTAGASSVLLADPLLEPALTSSGPNSLRALQLELDKAQTARLQRRYIALDNRLQEARARRDNAASNATEDSGETDTAQNEIKAASLRKERLSKMIAAQRAVIEGMGGTSADFEAALSTADVGSGLDLDATLKKFDIFAKYTTVAKAERRKAKSTETESTKESFPLAAHHVQAPTFGRSFQPSPKIRQTLTSLSPVPGRLIAPPTPYVPDLRDLETYMATGYTAPMTLHPVRPATTPKVTRHHRATGSISARRTAARQKSQRSHSTTATTRGRSKKR